MIIKVGKKIVPLLPLSALLVYLIFVSLWTFEILPDPKEIVVLLKDLYEDYGLFGIFVATVLEGLAYLGLYFSGATVMLLGVILSDGKFITLLIMSVIVAAALTLASILNYGAGRALSIENKKLKIDWWRKSFLFSCLHPNFLAFYFFTLGVRGGKFIKIFYVPFILIPYGFAMANIFYIARPILQKTIENPVLMVLAILIWFGIAFYSENRKVKKRWLFF